MTIATFNLENLKVIRRNGDLAAFNKTKINHAITNAFLDEEGSSASGSARVHDLSLKLTEDVCLAISNAKYLSSNGTINIETIQDQVELALLRRGELNIARSFIAYREEHKKLRVAKLKAVNPKAASNSGINVILADGTKSILSEAYITQIVADACSDLSEVKAELIIQDTLKNLFHGVHILDVRKTLIMSARTLIETEPNYSYVAARLLLNNIFSEILPFLGINLADNIKDNNASYSTAFINAIHMGIKVQRINPELANFDLVRLSKELQPARDFKFTYLGLQILYDRYFLHYAENKFELPQVFFMRVAMGLALAETDKNQKAIQFYNLLSSFAFMSSTPTLFNAGTLHSQLSSCYLSTIPDDLFNIYGAIRDNALLAKFAGGLGNDWTQIRGMNAYIKGTNGKSQGVIPFMKVANDTAVAVNQGGKRKGAVCAYLETWHIDIEEFLELRKNTGDERRRTHDMNTANWVPDLFMQRVLENKEWTLFSPDEVKELHDLYGLAFADKYHEYEVLAIQGKINNYKIISAVTLWRKMLTMLFETGHPWITFKDACNLRSPQQHVGVIHSSNLCTEITLNTSQDEIAVCNLGSVNLSEHINAHGLDTQKLEQTIQTAIRMLDNVIDINFYPVPQAKTSNLLHRPIGLGLMGFQDCLYKLNISYSSEQAVEFADRSMEHISYYAIAASVALAKERGVYTSFAGSLWSKGILPLDSIEILQANRGIYLDQDRSQTLDWNSLREQVRTIGMRNSNVMAIAPTATIANICGVTQSIEPTYQNLFVKSNLSGEFTIVNEYLVRDLKSLNLWDKAMVNDLKYYNGSLLDIERIPEQLRQKYATAFEVPAKWLVECASRRQKWIDQAQSLNIYIPNPSGKELDVIYRSGWLRGLKTFYYMRALAATSTEKSTVDKGTLNAVQINQSPVCSIDDPSCESCQ